MEIAVLRCDTSPYMFAVQSQEIEEAGMGLWSLRRRRRQLSRVCLRNDSEKVLEFLRHLNDESEHSSQKTKPVPPDVEGVTTESTYAVTR
jgi:hypothetical protein